MIRTVLFVHGTGVRKTAYEQSASRIMRALAATPGAPKLEPCLWGDEHGARLRMGGASIPEFSGVEGTPSGDDQSVALWELLGRDPLFELRELTASARPGLAPPPELHAKQAFIARAQSLTEVSGGVLWLHERVLEAHWQQSVRAICGDAAFKAAVATNKIGTPMRLATARAVMGALQQQLVDNNFPLPNKAQRDEFVEVCVTYLGGRDLGVKDWITGRLVGFGLRWATEKAKRERDAVFNAASPVAGDILLYQARGMQIRDYIAQCVGACGDDVAIIAHSLGGIACVDLLIERRLPQVKLLVTVGSQAPLLYEIGALWSLPFGDHLPEHFPPRWINFWDRNDLLSYKAAPIFKPHAIDHEIKSGQPFPQAHSAYWNDPILWQKLAPHLLADA